MEVFFFAASFSNFRLPPLKGRSNVFVYLGISDGVLPATIPYPSFLHFYFCLSSRVVMPSWFELVSFLSYARC
jgi:hypothetical protein